MSRPKHFVLTLAFLCNPKLIQTTAAFSSSPGDGFNSNRSNISNGNNPKPDRYISAAQRARREEEQRRKERMNEVAPGKTSAIPGAKDFAISVDRTEMEWNMQASGEMRMIKELTAKGMEALRMLKLEEADKAFNSLYEIKPNAYCWQAAIVKFYMDDYEAAAECFTKNAQWYESKFGQVATEERIWRQACELKLKSMSKKNRSKVDPITTLSPLRDHDLFSQKETRKVIRIAHELFTASLENNVSNTVLARAKLRSICGQYDSNCNDEVSLIKTDKKMWRLYSWYYLGLHYDAIGDENASKDCMKMALRQCVSGNSSDIIQSLPILHMSIRDWFDDDDFEEDDGSMYTSSNDNKGGLDWDISSSSSNNSNKPTGTSAVVSSSNAREFIEQCVTKMKIAELQNELKRRGSKSAGSKSVLMNRLRQILLEDAGLKD
mmetsp:Transcript_4234/g.8098  ORF Transcript_4234/g.8098 Transcript_4234/m.8098 type:complete len:435 (+) Transcript_4234:239-1543(+)